MWMRRETVRIAGSRDLRAGAGQPVLDAVERSVAALRELPAGAAMLEHLEFDGDVEAGAGMVAEAVFLLWAPDETALSDLSGRLRLQLDGDWTISAPVPSIAPDERVRRSCIAMTLGLASTMLRIRVRTSSGNSRSIRWS